MHFPHCCWVIGTWRTHSLHDDSKQRTGPIGIGKLSPRGHKRDTQGNPGLTAGGSIGDTQGESISFLESIGAITLNYLLRSANYIYEMQRH